MRKVLLLGLVLVLLLGFIGCGGEEEFDPSGGKVVEAKYRGTFERNNDLITLSEKAIIFSSNAATYQAWTVNEDVYYYHPEQKNIHHSTFEDDNNLKLIHNGNVFTRRP